MYIKYKPKFTATKNRKLTRKSVTYWLIHIHAQVYMYHFLTDVHMPNQT